MKETERERLKALTGPLLDWYRENYRALPWREDPSPYRVWLSEIMLQQTRIEAVLGYFARFLERLPDIPSLAAAEEDTVLKLWEGLGYYSRARNLKKAAEICVERYGGSLPDTYEGLLALPGIGPYTAGAIGSIAWHLPVPVVDGNVLRVASRILADGGDISQPAVRTRFWNLLKEVIPAEEPDVFNQAWMELGERVCIPNGRPDCAACPVREYCLAHGEGRETEYPVKAPRKARRVEEKTILVISCASRFAVRRRPDQGLLAGMYEFPWLPGKKSRREVADWAAGQTGRFELRELPDARHIFTHMEWDMSGYRIDSPEEWGTGWFFEEADVIREQLSLPAAFRTYTKELAKRGRISQM